jgi:hypothetical protein
MAKTNPFDYTNSINTTKKNLMRALSYHNDTVFYANEMNTRHHLDNLLQYEYFLNIIRPKKRYAKWAKKDNDGDVLLVKEYYGYNDSKARQALAILSTEQLNIIRTKMHKGGTDG